MRLAVRAHVPLLLSVMHAVGTIVLLESVVAFLRQSVRAVVACLLADTAYLCVCLQYSGIRTVRRGCLLDSLLLLNAVTVMDALGVGVAQAVILAYHPDLSREHARL